MSQNLNRNFLASHNNNNKIENNRLDRCTVGETNSAKNTHSTKQSYC